MKLLKAATVFTLGILVGQTLFSASSSGPSGLEVAIGLLAAVAVIGAATCARKHVGLAVLLLLALLGIVRGAAGSESAAAFPWSDLPRNEERVTLEGTLLRDPAASNVRTRLRLHVSVAQDEQSTTAYPVDVYTERLHDRIDATRRSDDFRYGDRYRFSGRFLISTGATGRGDAAGTIFTSSVELIETGGGNGLRSAIAGYRSSVSYFLVDSLGSKTGGLAAAMLVGDRTKLLPETIDDFRASGLAHVLAISGLHIAMVGGIVVALSAWAIGRQKQLYLIAPALAVWGYATMAGLSPSVTRAAIMFTVYMAARLFGRQRSVLPPLALAATVMLAIDPEIISSVSFQLSFAAVLGIALFSARIAAKGSDWIESSRRIPSITKRPLAGIVYGMSVSLAATVATAPLVAFYFGEIPVWGIPSTLLLVPALPLFIGGSVLVAVAGAVIATPIAAVGAIALGIGNYMSFIAETFASLPLGPVDAEGWSIALIAGWYGVLVLMLNRRLVSVKLGRVSDAVRRIFVRRPGARKTVARSRKSRYAYTVVVIWVAAAASFAGSALTDTPSQDLTITFFETNRGDMILVETPSGARLLIDGGDDSDLAVQNLESVLPPLDRRIDVVLSTHPDADHLGGLQRIVERFDVGTIIDSGVPHNSAIYESWTHLIDEFAGDERVITALAGVVVALDDDVALTVLQTNCTLVECSNFNDESVVTRLDFRDVSFLLTSDITSSAETDLLLTNQRVKSTVLKVGHHGSRTSTSPVFLDAVDPAVAIVTTGIKNQFGHPHDEVMNRLYEQLPEEAVYVTRDRGTVTVTTDGERVWVRTER
ncbi:MAG: ComEC/Rec2 family competence protein [Chloroflexi bacterium]|nr:ComEC/Rec2 family competence protein [Chloroflexota bacterium]